MLTTVIHDNFDKIIKELSKPQYVWTNLVGLPHCQLWRVTNPAEPKTIYYIRKRYDTVYGINIGTLN